MGTSMTRIARTWLWIDPIYTWYRDLNKARNICFSQQGLIAADGRPVHLPASTGIGLHPVLGDISLEAIATIDGPSPTTLAAGGKQNCALDYGSAFSRAATLRTPSGDTCYVSGTAAIDAAGKTVFLGDREGQVVDTIRNVRAVLKQLAVTEADVVQGVAYCIDSQVVDIWNRLNPGWPLAVVLADICRDDLLFEIELAACPGAHRTA
jgi:enamine deaminase RidA (YjgF/YER057c/UK114 family)